ncbi:helix-turn-helix domain-containing protein [Streptomyces sp. NPDC097610]|uniref:helix-turn-helix domain-containing protein n=1 Tax=Streptomyces sp. NPDC097610 TaxID=3157227 RepID=UPI00331CCC42
MTWRPGYANTLRYRLTQIEQTVGVNLTDPGIRLVFALVLGERCPLGEKSP